MPLLWKQKQTKLSLTWEKISLNFRNGQSGTKSQCSNGTLFHLPFFGPLVSITSQFPLSFPFIYYSQAASQLSCIGQDFQWFLGNKKSVSRLFCQCRAAIKLSKEPALVLYTAISGFMLSLNDTFSMICFSW